ncbi:DUF4145 domain-containing protein [Massilia sp. Root335]|uniref:DUF4145 domain-containing protein n=1 Tax=Massilia sp. Root335 TaxID=1736517 RepID=UPI0009E75CC7|nr:DUF4145 domain-containing protein [Massilia sp. Root335]
MPTIKITERETYECDQYPDECPVCHKHVHATLKLSHIAGTTREVARSARIEAVFLCPNSSCASLFIAYFREATDRYGHGNGEFRFTGAAPRASLKPMVFEGIVKLSPNFFEIYTQATEADHRRLDQVAGVGYRKALEFLVKDYCCDKNPDDADTIKKTALAACIDRYVNDQNIKDCAKLAAWLGNDETHYVRKWNDKDVQDLKALMGLAMSWIETSIKTDQYRASMLNKS